MRITLLFLIVILVSCDNYEKYNEANRQFQNGNYDSALSLVDELIKDDSEYQLTLNLKGLILVELGRPKDAIENYEKALSIEHNAVIFHNKGLALEKIKYFDDAMTAYDTAIMMDSTKGEFFYNRGQLYQKLGKYDNAINNYEISFTINPSNYRAMIYSAILYAKENETDNALKLIEKVSSKEKLSNKDNYWLGFAHFELKECKIALDIWAELVTDNHEQKNILLTDMASAEFKLGNIEKAKNIYRKVIQSDSLMSFAYNGLGVLYQENSKLDSSIIYLDKAIKINPNPTYIYNRGVSYLEQGKKILGCKDINKAKNFGFVGGAEKFLSQCY